MLAWKTGVAQPGTAATSIYAWTFGKRAAGNLVTNCLDGEAAEFVFNDTVVSGDGVGLLMPSHGGTALPMLAGGIIPELGEVCVKRVAIAGVTVSVAIAVADADVGDIIVGRLTNGTSAAAADTDLARTSLAVLLYTEGLRAKTA